MKLAGLLAIAAVIAAAWVIIDEVINIFNREDENEKI